ncbi:MAG: alpha-ketoglutarate-dependent dioxygenase AlkB [Agarilytica sp.]
MLQDSLFPSHETKDISLFGFGELHIVKRFLNGFDADHYFDILKAELDWQQPTTTVFGKTQKIPRLQAWYGDEGKAMRYSGQSFMPTAWHPSLIALKAEIETEARHKFNSVLANMYRNGNDSVGWHADDEKELGDKPIIASLSLGESRRFCLKPKNDRLPNGEVNKIRVDLASGDLLVMKGDTQRFWQHAVLKAPGVIAPRINLTFRKII